MGLDTASIQFICAAKSLGVDFTKVLMIGRQLLLPEKSALQHVFTIHGIDVDATRFLETTKYGEEFFAFFGGKEIQSLDYSDYENASIIHDMNSPIPAYLRDRFSLVYDGGTLEHIFNVPQALKNCMEMVAIGGHFLQANIANNFMGHGFWQFSPELLFRVFSPQNGFETELVLLHEVVAGGTWVSVADPVDARQRVELCNDTPTYIFTIARKVSNVEVFAKPPLQSDYLVYWDRAARERYVDAAFARRQPRPHAGSWPEPVKPPLRPGPFDRHYYRRISEENLLRGILGSSRGIGPDDKND